MHGSDPTRWPHRVVVVDDCPDACDSLALLLQAEGWEVRAFRGAAGILAELAAFSPDAVFLDLELASDGALHLARDMRDHPRLRRALIVAMTGWSGLAAPSRARAVGIDACFLKGGDPHRLIALATRPRDAGAVAERRH